MRRLFTALLGAIASIVAVVGDAVAQRPLSTLSPVYRGEAALQRHEIPAAIAEFRLAAADSNAQRRAAAERMLAIVSWRFQRDFVGARQHLARALAAGSDSAATLTESARLATAENHAGEGRAHAERALAAATSDEARRLAIRELAAATIEPELAARLDRTAVPQAERPQAIDFVHAIELLRPIVRRPPVRTDDAYQLLLVALLAGDGTAALEGWRAYFALSLNGGAYDGAAGTDRALAQVLPRWTGPASLHHRDRTRIADLLASSRLYEAAALLAPARSDVRAYASYCRKLARDVDEYYRRTLMGERRNDDLLRAYYRNSRDLWSQLSWQGAAPPFYPAAMAPELSRRFGAIVHFGVTGGFFDLHFAHVLAETTIVVTQYGHGARVRSLMLDGVVSNGLQSWAWDQAGAHGGWQLGDTVLQVRPVFVDHTIALWIGTDSASHAREAARIAADSVSDWTLAAADSAGYLPGVEARLRRDSRNALIDSLRGAGIPDSMLANVFVSTAARLTRESAIFAHEGRHALDDRLAPGRDAEEREYRAKLSEIVFAKHPKLQIGSIIRPNIGDATPHGRANRRVMLGLLAWMRQHTSEIYRLDARRAFLPQLPLLSEDQLRAAFRSMDPLAREASNRTQ
jgi:hypothetical protein